MGFLTPIIVLSACISSPTYPWGGVAGGCHMFICVASETEPKK